MERTSKRYASMFRVARAVVQAIPSGVFTPVQWDNESFDELDEMAIINPWTFIPKRHGFYHLFVNTRFQALPAGSDFAVYFYLNGAITYGGFYDESLGIGALNNMALSSLLELDENDNVDIRVWQATGVPRNLAGNAFESYFFGYRVR